MIFKNMLVQSGALRRKLHEGLDFRPLLSPDILEYTARADNIRRQRRTLTLLQFQTSLRCLAPTYTAPLLSSSYYSVYIV